MFCPSCGKDVNPDLSYCNQCGARLNVAADPRALPATNFNTLLGAVIGLPFIGLGMLFGVIMALKGSGFKDDFIFAITFLTFLLFAIAEIGCVIMLVTRTKGSRPLKDKAGPISERHQLDEAMRRGLGGPTFEPMPVGSVTDHTTRALDEPGIRNKQ